MVSETAQDTFAPAVDNIVEAPEAPVVETEAPVESPVEAVAAEAEAPERAATRPLYELPDDELPADARELIRRREQAAHDRALAEANRQKDVELAGWVTNEGYTDELATAYSVDATGDVQVDRNHVRNTAGRMRAGFRNDAQAEMYQGLAAIVPFEELGAEGREQVRAAGDNWIPAYVQEAVKHLAAQNEAKTEPERRKAYEAEFRKAEQARQTVAQREQASDARTQNRGATTGINGAAPSTFSSKREIDRAHMNGDITTAQLREWRDSGRYSQLPF